MSAETKYRSALGESPLHTEELARLNRNYSTAQTLTDAQSKQSFLNKLLAPIRRILFSDYAAAQTEFQADLVRVLNRLSSLEDVRLWRMEDEQRGTLEGLERDFQKKLQQERDTLIGTLSQMESRVDAHQEQLAVLESVTKGLERILGAMSSDVAQAAATTSESDSSKQQLNAQSLNSDYRYVLLENRYRGSEEQISTRLSVYVDYFRGSTKPVVEIGSGRGEFLELLREANISAYGLEIDAAMQELCVQKSLDVRKVDGIAHLESCEDNSLGGLLAVQVVEHLTVETLETLLRLAAKKVVAGGYVIFETINTKSVLALCQNYFRDPTHAQPLHPQTMAFMAEMSGLEVKEIRELSPYPPEATLQSIPLEEFMTPSARQMAELINHNFSALNSILFGFQDYSIVATPDSRG